MPRKYMRLIENKLENTAKFQINTGILWRTIYTSETEAELSRLKKAFDHTLSLLDKGRQYHLFVKSGSTFLTETPVVILCKGKNPFFYEKLHNMRFYNAVDAVSRLEAFNDQFRRVIDQTENGGLVGVKYA